MGESKSIDWTTILIINLLVTIIGACLAYIFAIRKMKREWNWKVKDAKLQSAIKVHADIKQLLRDLNDIPCDDSTVTTEKYVELLGRFDTRLDSFSTGGRRFFPNPLSDEIQELLREARVVAQRFASTNGKGYADVVQKTIEIDKRIAEYADTLSKALES